MMARHPIHFKSVIGLGIKRYFHLYDMLNFMRGGILKLYIVNPCFLWCVFSMYYFNEEQVCNEKKNQIC